MSCDKVGIGLGENFVSPLIKSLNDKILNNRILKKRGFFSLMTINKNKSVSKQTNSRV